MSDEQVEAFQELIAGIYIQQLRIYDLLAVLVSERMPEKMDRLEKMHSEGKVLSPDPALRVNED
jgi:hypothetical protein